jgi:histidinol phosphatase-like PHP family hydrolase
MPKTEEENTAAMIAVNHDLHIHTYLSACCKDKENQTPRKILARAEAMGLETIGFSDHIWTNPQLEPNHFYRQQDERQIIHLKRDLESASSPLRVLVGCEADTIAPGKFSITREFADTLDYVGLSCSHLHLKGLVQQPSDHGPRSIGEHLLALFLSAAESGLATTIVHPLFPKGFESQYDQVIASLSDAELLGAFSTAAAAGAAVEITTAFLPPGAKYGNPSAPGWRIETPLRVLSLAKTAGCKFTFGSDAHSPAAMMLLPKLRLFSERLGLTDEDLAPIVLGART